MAKISLIIYILVYMFNIEKHISWFFPDININTIKNMLDHIHLNEGFITITIKGPDANKKKSYSRSPCKINRLNWLISTSNGYMYFVGKL